MTGISDLKWSSDFISQTPGDNTAENFPRQVLNACWSHVIPSIVPNPKMIIWSEEMANILKIDKIEIDLLSGNSLCPGMAPYAQCYGGHQFGSWAGQLGDGRAITLGEINSEFGKLELQLKGSGVTPYSR
ncbi:MAG: protein adenylyltransferase SelO family protein, partial [Candidatus Poseidoniales archaeon]